VGAICRPILIDRFVYGIITIMGVLIMYGGGGT